jgi:hypothetical protein
MDPIIIGLFALAWNSARKRKQDGPGGFVKDLSTGNFAYSSGPGHPLQDTGVKINGNDYAAFLYQLPEDSFTTTRLAVSSGGDDPREVGIFGTPDKAIAVAQSNGWTIAHSGQVLQLKTKPGA